MTNPNDSEPLPSLRSPEKRQSQFNELEDNPIANSGKRTMPHDLEQKIETWQRHGRKILEQMRVNSLIVTRGDLFCVVTLDRDKKAAVQMVLDQIDRKRKEAQTLKSK